MSNGSSRRPLAKPEEVSEYIGVPVPTLYQWRHRKVELGPLAIPVGRHLRWKWDDVDAWLAKKQKQAGERGAA